MGHQSRVTGKSILRNLLDSQNLSKKLFTAVWELTVRPGKAIKSYLGEEDSQMIDPIKYFLLIFSLISFIVYIGELLSKEESVSIVDKTHTDSIILFGLFIGACLTLVIISYLNMFLFKKQGFSFGEHLIINIFCYSHLVFLTFIIFIIPEIVLIDIFHLHYLDFFINPFSLLLLLIPIIIYSLYVYKRIFEYGNVKTLTNILINIFVFLIMFSIAGVLSIMTESKMLGDYKSTSAGIFYSAVVLSEKEKNERRSKQKDDYYKMLVDSLIADGPANLAGIKPGDFILGLNGDKVFYSDSIFYWNLNPKDKCYLTVMRDEQQIIVEVTLTHRDSLGTTIVK